MNAFRSASATLIGACIVILVALTMGGTKPRKNSAASHAMVAPDPEGMALLQQSHRMIADYHAGQAKNGAVLRIVYFHPKDRDPLPNFAERLERVMSDVSDFYRDGLRRFGVPNEGLPLEREGGKLVLHLVRGKWPAKDYSYSSGSETAEEIRVALKEKFDTAREHVLVIYGLCRKEDDGRYVFDAPYYGRGSHAEGVCHAADCELLDPRLLTKKGPRMVFSEHYHLRKETSVAEFNSWYLGGLAHELGHGLGVFHDAGMQAEEDFGTSLMGMGNLTYRNEVHGGDSPAFLARITALQLASHPLFTGSDRGRWDKIEGGIEDTAFVAEGNVMHIRGQVSGAIAPYAVVAHVWRTGLTDHSARTYAVVLHGGNFDLPLPGLEPSAYFVRLTSLHVNGGATWKNYDMGFDGAGRPESPWIVAQAERAILQGRPDAKDLTTEASIARASTKDQSLLRVLRGVWDAPLPINLATVEGKSAWVSDAQWKDASVGWGQVARNHYWFDENIQDGVFLQIGKRVYLKGLYAHSSSRYVFDLGGKWKTFTSTIALRDGAPQMGTAVFRVVGDGKELYRSRILRTSNAADIKVEVTGVKQLELKTEGGEGHNHGSWAIWVSPEVTR